MLATLRVAGAMDFGKRQLGQRNVPLCSETLVAEPHSCAPKLKIFNKVM